MKRGFTLIELLVVIGIIALLLGIILANFGPARAKSRDGERISDLGQIQLALTLFYDRCGHYPQPAGGAVVISASCPDPENSGGPDIVLSNYIDHIPTPPAGAGTLNYYEYIVNDSSLATDYVLHTSLEYANGSAVANGLSTAPSYASSLLTCSNAPDSTNYCIGPK